MLRRVSKYLRVLTVSMLCMLSVFFAACTVGPDEIRNYIITGLDPLHCMLSTYNTQKTKARAAATDIKAYLGSLKNEIDIRDENSKIYYLNKEANVNEPVEISEDFYQMFLLGKDYYEKTEGIFNIAVLPALELWGLDFTSVDLFDVVDTIPSENDVAAVMDYCTPEKFITSGAKGARTIKKTHALAKLDFGGIAKGYAAKEVQNILTKHKVKGAVFNYGGSSIYAHGSKNGGKKFNIHLEDADTIIYVKNQSVTTSGNYERYYIYDNQEIGHILNGKTGFPSTYPKSGTAPDIKAVSVITPQNKTSNGGALGEVWSTVLMCYNVQTALSMASDVGISVVLVNLEGQVFAN